MGTRKDLKKRVNLNFYHEKKSYSYKYTYISEHLMRSENSEMGHEKKRKDKRKERSAYMI